MTLPPDRIGDKGLRYEVTFFDPGAGERKVFGWASNLDGARSFAEAITRHPSMRLPQIFDRSLCVTVPFHIGGSSPRSAAASAAEPRPQTPTTSSSPSRAPKA